MRRPLAGLFAVVAVAAAFVSFSPSRSQDTTTTAPVKLPPPAPLLSRRGPTQPIAFSHKMHAGTLAMDCLYCHNSADKSPIANIPAISVCMGCHKLAVTDRPEIKKLAGYWERGENPPWVEVYRLPDHVKFNHKRHVKAGFDCAECHGKVAEMDVVHQATSLKMGWCITCHRQNVDHKNFPATMDCVACHH